jgi:hypothetical protein
MMVDGSSKRVWRRPRLAVAARALACLGNWDGDALSRSRLGGGFTEAVASSLSLCACYSYSPCDRHGAGFLLFLY